MPRTRTAPVTAATIPAAPAEPKRRTALWQRSRSRKAEPLPDDEQRQQAFAILRECEIAKYELPGLAREALDADRQLTLAKEAAVAAERVWRTAVCKHDSKLASIEARARRAENTLKATAPKLLDEFAQAAAEEVDRLQKSLSVVPLLGETRVDGSRTYAIATNRQSLEARVIKLRELVSTAASWALEDATEDELSQRLEDAYAELPTVTVESSPSAFPQSVDARATG